MVNSSVVPMTPLPLGLCIWKVFLISKFPEKKLKVPVCGWRIQGAEDPVLEVPAFQPPQVDTLRQKKKWRLRLCGRQEITCIPLYLELLWDAVGPVLYILCFSTLLHHTFMDIMIRGVQCQGNSEMKNIPHDWYQNPLQTICAALCPVIWKLWWAKS